MLWQAAEWPTVMSFDDHSSTVHLVSFQGSCMNCIGSGVQCVESNSSMYLLAWNERIAHNPKDVLGQFFNKK